MESDWRKECFSVKDRHGQLLEKGYYSDCSFLVADGSEEERKVFMAHKLLLADASAVFGKMFFSSLSENTAQPIKIEDIQAKTFSLMLQYIYTDNVDLKGWKDAANLLNAANKYMLHQLKKYCIEYLVTELYSSNALEIYEFAKFYKEENLMEAALKVIREETIAVLNSPNFLKINISTMITVLVQNQLQTTEMELFVALESLAKSQGVIEETPLTDNTNEELTIDLIDKKKIELYAEFRKAVKKIQFNLMTPQQFSNGPSTSELLLPEEAVSILNCLLRPSKLNTVYPKDFQQNIRLSKYLPRVFMDFNAGDLSIGRIVIELRSDIVPKTVKKFLENLPLLRDFNRVEFDTYHRFFTCSSEGTPGNFENNILNHSGFGTVSVKMVRINGELKSLCGGCMIAFEELAYFDRTRVVIGQVVEGMDVVDRIKSYGTKERSPNEKIIIKSCGELKV